MSYIKENKGSALIPPTMYSLKSIILISLCLQNAGYTLLRKYTTKYEKVSAKEILFVSEIIKILFSIYMVLQDEEIKLPYKGEGENDQAESVRGFKSS